MKKLTTVNNGRADAKFSIEAVEKKYNAKFVGQFCLRTRGGGWHGDDCADVYYQETPPVAGYSNYFGLIVQNGTTYITSGASGVEGIINCVQADDGEIIYSRFRHDYRVSTDKSVFIDGGRDYVHGGLHGKYFAMKVVDGEFYEAEPEDYPGEDESDKVTVYGPIVEEVQPKTLREIILNRLELKWDKDIELHHDISWDDAVKLPDDELLQLYEEITTIVG
jgi:hypothetical protein